MVSNWLAKTNELVCMCAVCVCNGNHLKANEAQLSDCKSCNFLLLYSRFLFCIFHWAVCEKFSLFYFLQYKESFALQHNIIQIDAHFYL